MVELAYYLALLDEVADIDRRGEYAAGDQRRDIGRLVGVERAVSSKDAGTVREMACAVAMTNFCGPAAVTGAAWLLAQPANRAAENSSAAVSNDSFTIPCCGGAFAVLPGRMPRIMMLVKMSITSCRPCGVL
ncbi:MAG: hypothetical protein WDO73_24865 [Ignavibacteriota bacterium]